MRLTSPQRYESASLSSTEATLFLEQFEENDCFRTHQVHLNITWRNSTPNSQVYSMVSDTLDASTSNKVQITLTGLTSATQYTIQVRTESLSDPTIASTYSTFTITTTTPSVTDPPDVIGLQGENSGSVLCVKGVAVLITRLSNLPRVAFTFYGVI